jgi:hypothetical protein
MGDMSRGRASIFRQGASEVSRDMMFFLAVLGGLAAGGLIAMSIIIMAAQRNSPVPVPSFWRDYVFHYLLGIRK